MEENIMLKICLGIFFLLIQSFAFGDRPKTWSILIPTLEKRQELFQKIHKKLTKQIEENHLSDHIEILVACDKGEKAIGKKRNDLMHCSQSEYICFIDDDDDVHDRYIPLIYEKLIHEKPDCINLIGIITFDGKNPKKFIHSIQYRSYFEEKGIYYRPPNHLNPLKREIAIQFTFPSTSFGEDTDWAMQVCRSGLLKKESTIQEPFYFYLYRTVK